MPLDIVYVSLFPEMVLNASRYSMLAKAEQKELVRFSAVNPRDFAPLPHRKVDDSPYGGGPGMVMKPEPLSDALESLNLTEDDAVVFTDPTGDPYEQSDAIELAGYRRVVFVCGHYEGIDERVPELYATHVYSIGDYVLTGGELPALVMADSIVRLQPGVLGKAESLAIDSFSDGLLSAPQYTRPEEYKGLRVPDVLLSGHHDNIAAWKQAQAEQRTQEFRPDLFDLYKARKNERG